MFLRHTEVNMFTISEAAQSMMQSARRLEIKNAEYLAVAKELEITSIDTLANDAKVSKRMNDHLATLWNIVIGVKKVPVTVIWPSETTAALSAASDAAAPLAASLKHPMEEPAGLETLQKTLDTVMTSVWDSEAHKANTLVYYETLDTMPQLHWMIDVVWANLGEMSVSGQRLTMELQTSVAIFKTILEAPDAVMVSK